MSAKNLKKKSGTDWKALEEMSDAEIDVSDIPPLTDSFFARARLVVPMSQRAIELDADVLVWFKTHSRNYQQQINRILREYIQIQKG